MRYHYKKPHIVTCMYGDIYECDHPIYNRCTLYVINKKGLAVIQQICIDKKTYWSEIDSWLADKIYLNTGFIDLFAKYASDPIEDIYPTITVRQLMWKLRMKPLPRNPWETYFDHCPL